MDRLRRSYHRQGAGWPDLPDGKVTQEVSDRAKSAGHGGLGVVHQLVAQLGLPRRLDGHVHALNIHRPHHESDQVVNLPCNMLCGGQPLDAVKLRRDKEARMNALGAQAIPDPATAGDVCRLFAEEDIEAPQDAFHAVRTDVGAAHPDRAIDHVRGAGFTNVLLNGDPDVSQTKLLDGWSEQGVRFVFGQDARMNLTQKAEGLIDGSAALTHRAKRAFVEVDPQQAHPVRHKDTWVRAKGCNNIILTSEDINKRRPVWRLPAWRPQLPDVFRLLDAL